MAPTPSRGGWGGVVRWCIMGSDGCGLRCVAAVAMRDLQPTLGPADAIREFSTFNFNVVASNHWYIRNRVGRMKRE